nr:Dabb family protein [Pedobacter sp. ASV19]
MIAHHVLFWLKADTTEDQKKAFRKSLETLKGIEVVKTFHIGTPAPIERAVVDTTYTFSLTLFFEDLAGHDVYQVHNLHKAFLDEFRILFDRVVIYDAEG